MRDKARERQRQWKRAVLPPTAPTPPAKTPSDIFATVESTAAGVLNFFGRFVRTMFLGAFRPARLAQRLGSEEGASGLVGPYTFICFVGFYAIKLLRRTLIFVFLAPFAILKGCDAETTSAIRWPTVWDLLTLPSLTDVLLIGLPLVGGILAIAWLIWRWLARGDIGQQPMYVRAICYCIGLEFLLLLPLCAFMAEMAYATDEKSQSVFKHLFGHDQAVTYGFYAASVVLLIAWPAWSLYRVLSSLRAAAVGPLGGWFRAGTLLACAIAACLMMLFGLAMSYSAAQEEFEEKYKPNPLLLVSRIGPLVLAPSTEVTLAVANNTGETMQFLLAGSTIEGLDKQSYAVVPVGAHTPITAVFQLQPRERGWIRFKVGGPVPRHDFLRADAERLCMVELSARGSRRDVCSWIRGAASSGKTD